MPASCSNMVGKGGLSQDSVWAIPLCRGILLATQLPHAHLWLPALATPPSALPPRWGRDVAGHGMAEGDGRGPYFLYLCVFLTPHCCSCQVVTEGVTEKVFVTAWNGKTAHLHGKMSYYGEKIHWAFLLILLVSFSYCGLTREEEFLYPFHQSSKKRPVLCF